MKNKKESKSKPAVVYDKKLKLNYINQLERSRKYREINVANIKKSILILLSELLEVEKEINSQIHLLRDINKDRNNYLSVIWQSQKNITGLYGPYWNITEVIGGKKTRIPYFRKNNRGGVSEITLRTPTTRDINKIYKDKTSEVVAMNKVLVILRRKRQKLNGDLVNVFGIVKTVKVDFLNQPLFRVRYDERNYRNSYIKGVSNREVNVGFILNMLDMILDEIISDEKYIDKHILSVNLLTPKRYMGIGMSWVLYNTGDDYKNKSLSPFGPLRPQWTQIKRWTPNIHGDGTRQISYIRKLTREIIYQAQQGKIEKELMQLNRKITNLNKHRVKRLQVLRLLWKKFMRSYKRKQKDN